MIDYVGFQVASPPPGLNLSESRGETNTTIGVILLLTAAFFLFLRLLTRLRYQGAGIELDDHLMSLGLVHPTLRSYRNWSTTDVARFSMLEIWRAA